jgi:hypothetical protein
MADEPMPRDFGWRYIGWLAWCNAITILSTLQGVFAAVLLVVDVPDDPHPMLSHTAVRVIFLINAVLTALVAQIKRNNPPGPPPSKAPSVPLVQPQPEKPPA